MPPTHRRSTSFGRDRAAAEDDARRRRVVGHRVEDLARVLHAGIDQLEGRHHVLRGAQHIDQPHAGAFQRLAEHERELDLDPRHAVVGVRHLDAVVQQHVVQQMAVVRLVDLRGLLHRLRRQPDLVADDLRAGGGLVPDDLGLYRVGILDRDIGQRLGQLPHRLPLGLGGDEELRCVLAIRFRQHRRRSAPFSKTQ